MKCRVLLSASAAVVMLWLPVADLDAQVEFTNPDPKTEKSTEAAASSREIASSKWAEADINGDGKVTNDEARALVEQEARSAFAKYDADRSGEIERKEFPQKPEWIRAFGALDTDQSGTLSFEEGRNYFEQRATKRFQKMDTNDDGLLTPDELAPVKPVSVIESNMERDGNGDGLLSVSELASTGDVAYFEDLHIRADVDGSGTVSRTELADEYRRRAMAKDGDEDGGVTLEEFFAGQTEAGRAVSSLTFVELDRDGDGRITGEDLLTQPPEQAVTPKPDEATQTPESP